MLFDQILNMVKDYTATLALVRVPTQQELLPSN